MTVLLRERVIGAAWDGQVPPGLPLPRKHPQRPMKGLQLPILVPQILRAEQKVTTVLWCERSKINEDADEEKAESADVRSGAQNLPFIAANCFIKLPPRSASSASKARLGYRERPHGISTPPGLQSSRKSTSCPPFARPAVAQRSPLAGEVALIKKLTTRYGCRDHRSGLRAHCPLRVRRPEPRNSTRLLRSASFEQARGLRRRPRERIRRSGPGTSPRRSDPMRR